MNLSKFEDALAHSLDDMPCGKVREAALYSLMNGGKRMRPRLLFALLDAYHYGAERGIDAAISIEMMHTYSLIHDDLPAMDDDTLRRGKPTCHIQYGEDIAILAGDALLTHSFLYALHSSLDARIANKNVKELALAGGLNGMVYGQELDLENEGQAMDIDRLRTINAYKTGKLITLPLLMACHIARKDEDLDTWKQIGEYLGIMFQIQDDLFDQTKTRQEMGKDVHQDEANHKQTYVTLLGIEECEAIIQKYAQDAVSLLDTIMIDKDPMLAIFEEMLQRVN